MTAPADGMTATTTAPVMVPAFAVHDKITDTVLATLPLTVPIGDTVEAFERAGFHVTWRWSSLHRTEQS